MVGMTTQITVGLDNTQAARLAERAARAGVSPEELASRLLAEDLSGKAADASTQSDAFGFFDTGTSRVLRGRAVDELMAEGFGQ